jgi:type I restriction-modification system DNA methylase subunit
MNLTAIKPRIALNKAYLKIKPNRSDIEQFKTNLIQLLDRTNDTESEEFHKNLVIDFLKKTYYEPNHFINTKGKNDLVIHNGSDAKSAVGVIIEAKKPTNKAEMISSKKLNVKAFQELVLYFLRERITHKNLEVKHLVATNINEWFIFESALFEKLFAQNKAFVKQFEDFEAKRLSGIKTDFFYKDVAEPFIASITNDIEYTYFDIREYEKPLRNNEAKDDNQLIALFKLLSPEHLLKLPFANDSNSLDKRFYGELLHIIGLVETKEGGKKVIQRKVSGEQNTGSLLENAIIQLDSLDKIGQLKQPKQFGDTYDERLFNVGLELVITWINRILFLKLLEAQLISYHKGDKSFSFLNIEKLHDYDDLNSLFFQVLAKKHEQRNQDVKQAFEKVPYLNSSLFEPTSIEHETIFISNLRDDKTLPVFAPTVLKDESGKKKSGEINALTYLYEFLNAYDFSSEGSEEIQEDNKTLINASVLGLIFEKINGYKDGSFFTPGFITMYMCRETIRRAVVQKFNETKQWELENFDDLYDKIEDRSEANQIVNSIKICDPAVGSGHFLVSALNELIAVKNDLKILQDRTGKRLKEYLLEVVNDELIVADEDGELFEYNPKSKESQRVQETLFHEKQTIIENCLFGVDINPNSVKICRLRLWIELLKSAYYKNETELETLPNIDINIKCGNSLISRFALDADLKEALKKSKWTIDGYRVAVDTYRNAENKEQKREMERLIADIKSDFRSEISLNDPKLNKYRKLSGELFQMTNQQQLFEMSKKEKAVWNKKLEELTKDSKKLEAEIEEIKSNKIYENAFEWRFEFPEVLNDEGDFVGFDVVIGNPPYILSRETFDDLVKQYFINNFETIHEKPNLYLLFIEKSFKLLKAKGNFSFIIPNSVTGVESAYKIRGLLLKDNQIISIINLLGTTFEDVGVETCIITASKNESDFEIKYQSLNSGIINEECFSTIDPLIWKNNRNYIFDITSTDVESVIINKIKSNSKPLFKAYEIKVGLQAYENGKGKPKQTSEDVKNHIFDFDYKFDETTYRYLNGGDVGRYFIAWSGQWLRYGEWLSQPKKIEQFSLPRILIREITGKYPTVIQAMYVEEIFLNNKSILNVLQNDSKQSLFVLLGYLNSKLISFYHKRQTVKGNRSLFPKIVVKDLQNYPFPTNQELLLKIEEIVLLILKDKEMNVNTTTLESQIDQLVYELYGLTEEEIKIVEGV